MKSDFIKKLTNKLKDSSRNNYEDNYDTIRFGELNTKNTIMSFIKNKILKNKYISNYESNLILDKSINLIGNYGEKLEVVYDLLADEESKNWIVDLVAYKILGYSKVKLQSNNTEQITNLSKEKDIYDKTKYLEANFLGKNIRLNLADLNKIGYPIKMYIRNITHLYLNLQYNYKNQIKAEKGDIVLDCGVCYGDTVLYFAHQVGENGKVIGFEFIPSNLNIIEENLKLNIELAKRINIIRQPLWNETNKTTYFKDLGPASNVSFENFNGSEGIVKTITIDQLVSDLNLDKVNFIKMDIEGAEPYALEGAKSTIQKYKPKLAISIYHSMDDFVNIPIWINNLGLGYNFYIKHPTIHWEETILFAIIE